MGTCETPPQESRSTPFLFLGHMSTVKVLTDVSNVLPLSKTFRSSKTSNSLYCEWTERADRHSTAPKRGHCAERIMKRSHSRPSNERIPCFFNYTRFFPLLWNTLASSCLQSCLKRRRIGLERLQVSVAPEFKEMDIFYSLLIGGLRIRPHHHRPSNLRRLLLEMSNTAPTSTLVATNGKRKKGIKRDIFWHLKSVTCSILPCLNMTCLNVWTGHYACDSVNGL